MRTFAPAKLKKVQAGPKKKLMINRELIRIKTIQVIYSHYQKGGTQLDAAEKELMKSMSKAYDLYNSLLLLMVAVHRIAERTLETAQSRYHRVHDGELPSPKFKSVVCPSLLTPCFPDRRRNPDSSSSLTPYP